MIPSIGSKQGKVWGTTQLVFSHNDIEAHEIVVEAGGYCSRHYHKNKWNRFYVCSGSLIVRMFQENQVDETVVEEGETTDVPPGVLHEFEAREAAIAFEFYWTELDPNDIERENVGGMKSDS